MNEAATSRTLEESIAQYASKAALNTYGVHSLYGGLAGNITKNLVGRDSSTRGVKISQNEDHKVLADIYVIVKFGCKIRINSLFIVKKAPTYSERLDFKISYATQSKYNLHD